MKEKYTKCSKGGLVNRYIPNAVMLLINIRICQDCSFCSFSQNNAHWWYSRHRAHCTGEMNGCWQTDRKLGSTHLLSNPLWSVFRRWWSRIQNTEYKIENTEYSKEVEKVESFQDRKTVQTPALKLTMFRRIRNRIQNTVNAYWQKS